MALDCCASLPRDLDCTVGSNIVSTGELFLGYQKGKKKRRINEFSGCGWDRYNTPLGCNQVHWTVLFWYACFEWWEKERRGEKSLSVSDSFTMLKYSNWKRFSHFSLINALFLFCDFTMWNFKTALCLLIYFSRMRENVVKTVKSHQ